MHIIWERRKTKANKMMIQVIEKTLTPVVPVNVVSSFIQYSIPAYPMAKSNMNFICYLKMLLLLIFDFGMNRLSKIKTIQTFKMCSFKKNISSRSSNCLVAMVENKYQFDSTNDKNIKQMFLKLKMSNKILLVYGQLKAEVR